MARRSSIPLARYQKILEEASQVAEMIKTPGWKILEEDLLKQCQKIEELLVENRLRTVTETITQGGSQKTFTTSAETQIAENAGMYKQIKQLFSTIQTIVEAPDRLAKLEAQGLVVIEKGDSQTPPAKPEKIKIPAAIEKARKKISRIIRKAGGSLV